MLFNTMDATAQWDATRALRGFTHDVLTGADSVLDVGCGLADVLISLAKERPRSHLAGIDASAEMVGEATRRAQTAGVEIKVRVGDATALDFDDNTFDASRTERVLQWLTDPQAAINEMVRVTKPGGWVVLIDSDFRTLATTLVNPVMREIMAGRTGGAVGGFLRSYAKAAGLIDIEYRVAAHARTDWADDGSSGVPAIASMIDQARQTHRDRLDDITAVQAELQQLLDNDDFFSTLTIIAVKGRVPPA